MLRRPPRGAFFVGVSITRPMSSHQLGNSQESSPGCGWRSAHAFCHESLRPDKISRCLLSKGIDGQWCACCCGNAKGGLIGKGQFIHHSVVGQVEAVSRVGKSADHRWGGSAEIGPGQSPLWAVDPEIDAVAEPVLIIFAGLKCCHSTQNGFSNILVAAMKQHQGAQAVLRPTGHPDCGTEG